MGKIVCIANQKGGVGKTTTAINLSASLAIEGKPTLLIDCDPQGNASSGVGINVKNVHKSIYHALVLDESFDQIVRKTAIDLLCVAPSNIDLVGAEIELVNINNREKRLWKILFGVIDKYEYIVIDCPPSLGLLTINSLVAADSVLIPIQCEYYALEGVGQLLRTIKLMKKVFNPKLKLEGLLLTMFDVRNNLSHRVAEEIKKHFSHILFDTIIPRNVRLGEAPSFGKPVILYDKSSRGAIRYMDLAREILQNKGNLYEKKRGFREGFSGADS